MEMTANDINIYRSHYQTPQSPVVTISICCAVNQGSSQAQVTVIFIFLTLLDIHDHLLITPVKCDLFMYVLIISHFIKYC